MTQDTSLKDGRRNRSSIREDSPPPRVEAMPSLKNFNIPKRNKKRELLTDVKLDSREAKDIIKTITNSFWEPDAYALEFNNIKLIYNETLEKEYSEKRQEMKEHPRADVTDSYAFLRLKSPSQSRQICQKGVYTNNQRLHLPPAPSGYIGDENYGIYLCRCADILSRRTTLDHISGECTLIVFKYMKGRLKAVASQSRNSSFEPTIDFDGHTSIHFQLGRKLPLDKTYDYSQVYLYEIDLDKMANDDDSMYTKRPRQCVPYAIVRFTTKKKQVQTKVHPVSIPTTQPSVSNMVPKAIESTEDTTFRYEEYSPKIKYTWQGFYFNHKRFLSEIQIGVYTNENDFCRIEGQNICVNQKISWEKLSLLLPPKMFRKPPCVSMKPKSCDESKSSPYYHAEIHPTSTPGRFIAVNKLIQRWIKTKSGGVCTFSSGMKLFLVPTGELTDKLGITCPGYPPILHCIFREHYSNEKVQNSPDFENFIKKKKRNLRIRLAQITEMKTSHRISDELCRNPNAFNRFDSEKLITCLELMRNTYEKTMKQMMDSNKNKNVSNLPNGNDDSDDDALTMNIIESESNSNICCEDPNCAHHHLIKKPADMTSRLMTDIDDGMDDVIDNDPIYDEDNDLSVEMLEESAPPLGGLSENMIAEESTKNSGKSNDSNNKLSEADIENKKGENAETVFSDISQEEENPNQNFDDISEAEGISIAEPSRSEESVEVVLSTFLSLQDEMRKQIADATKEKPSNVHIFQEVSSDDSLSEIASSISAARNKKRRKEVPRAYRDHSPGDVSSSSKEDSSISYDRRYGNKYRDSYSDRSSRSRSRSRSSRHRRRTRSRSRSSSRGHSPYHKSRKRKNSNRSERSESSVGLDKRRLYGSPSNVFSQNDVEKNKKQSVIEVHDDDNNGFEPISDAEPRDSGRLTPPPPLPTIGLQQKNLNQLTYTISNHSVQTANKKLNNKQNSSSTTSYSESKTAQDDRKRLKERPSHILEQENYRKEENHQKEDRRKEERRKKVKALISQNGLTITGSNDVSSSEDAGPQEWIKRAGERCNKADDPPNITESIDENVSGPDEWIKRAEKRINRNDLATRSSNKSSTNDNSKEKNKNLVNNSSSDGSTTESPLKGISELLEKMGNEKIQSILEKDKKVEKKSNVDDDDTNISFVVESKTTSSQNIPTKVSNKEHFTKITSSITTGTTSKQQSEDIITCKTPIVLDIDINTNESEDMIVSPLEPGEIIETTQIGPQDMEISSDESPSRSKETETENTTFSTLPEANKSKISQEKQIEPCKSQERKPSIETGRSATLLAWASLFKHQELDSFCSNLIEEMQKNLL